jgi:cytochrome c-type biogenesis protein CcmH/NrfG
MNPKRVVALLVGALAVYFVVIGTKAVALFAQGTVTGIGLGVGAVLLPLVGAVLVFFELRFGWQTQRLGRQLDAEGGLPDLADLPRRPSGRMDKKAALPHFETMKAQVEANPQDWRCWFRLADAYDVAGDRRRARESMRTAIRLHQQHEG